MSHQQEPKREARRHPELRPLPLTDEQRHILAHQAIALRRIAAKQLLRQFSFDPVRVTAMGDLT